MTPQIEHATPTECQIVERLVDDILAASLSIDVYDGGETTIRRCTDRAEIFAALASTGGDVLSIRNADGIRVGWVHLIWGNGCDLISDNSANAETEALVKGALDLAETLSG